MILDFWDRLYTPSRVSPTPHRCGVGLTVRRVKPTPGSQLAFFATYSYHGFITDRDGETLELEADHRRHAEIENAIRHLKYGVGLNHMPSGRFAANAAWLAVQVMADNLARWTARIGLGERILTTKTLRRRFFSLAGRLTRSARRLTLHLPKHWPDCEPFHTQSDQPSGNLPVDPALTHRPIERPGETPANLTAGVSCCASSPDQCPNTATADRHRPHLSEIHPRKSLPQAHPRLFHLPAHVLRWIRVYPSSSLRASSASSSLTRASAANLACCSASLACCSASLASLSCSKVGISRPVRGSRQRS